MSAFDDLVELFANAPTAIPRGPSKENSRVAEEAIEDIDLATILRDLGAILAREYATRLDALGLRPADYVCIPKLAERVVGRLASHLHPVPDTLASSFEEHLRSKG